MKVLFSGGGTLGSVTPLLAMQDALHTQNAHTKFFWLTTRKGPEIGVLQKNNISYATIYSGKLNRFLSIGNFFAPFGIIAGFFQAIYMLLKHSPDICISAGGYVSVPVHAAAWLFGIPTWIHQQDVIPGMSNKLMAPSAKKITTALQKSVQFFPKKKTSWMGNPVRKDVLHGSVNGGRARFHIKSTLPIVFGTGGGTGAARINELIISALPHLQEVCEVIHVTGITRDQDAAQDAQKKYTHYRAYDFFTDEMKDAYAVADIVVTRGGFGTLTELSALKKPTIVIPKPGHQEANVAYLAEHNAIIALDEQKIDGMALASAIKRLISDTRKAQQLGATLHEQLPIARNTEIVDIVSALVQKQ